MTYTFRVPLSAKNVSTKADSQPIITFAIPQVVRPGQTARVQFWSCIYVPPSTGNIPTPLSDSVEETIRLYNQDGARNEWIARSGPARRSVVELLPFGTSDVHLADDDRFEIDILDAFEVVLTGGPPIKGAVYHLIARFMP